MGRRRCPSDEGALQCGQPHTEFAPPIREQPVRRAPPLQTSKAGHFFGGARPAHLALSVELAGARGASNGCRWEVAVTFVGSISWRAELPRNSKATTHLGQTPSFRDIG